jgi:branched-chain amino acid aminotransferase
MTLAGEIGLKVERRKIPYEELETFEEIGACGTAAVISPVKRIYDADLDREFLFGNEPTLVNPVVKKLLDNTSTGEEPDPLGWKQLAGLNEQ